MVASVGIKKQTAYIHNRKGSTWHYENLRINDRSIQTNFNGTCEGDEIAPHGLKPSANRFFHSTIIIIFFLKLETFLIKAISHRIKKTYLPHLLIFYFSLEFLA